MTSSGYRPLWDQIVLVMSIKPALRLSIDVVARRNELLSRATLS